MLIELKYAPTYCSSYNAGISFDSVVMAIETNSYQYSKKNGTKLPKLLSEKDSVINGDEQATSFKCFSPNIPNFTQPYFKRIHFLL